MSDTDIKRVALSFTLEEVNEIMKRHVIDLGFDVSDRFRIIIGVNGVDIPEGVWAKVNKLPPVQ